MKNIICYLYLNINKHKIRAEYENSALVVSGINPNFFKNFFSVNEKNVLILSG